MTPTEAAEVLRTGLGQIGDVLEATEMGAEALELIAFMASEKVHVEPKRGEYWRAEFFSGRLEQWIHGLGNDPLEAIRDARAKEGR